MVITVMSVATPIVSPSMVSKARSLWARIALKHCSRLSRLASRGRVLSLYFTESRQTRRTHTSIRGFHKEYGESNPQVTIQTGQSVPDIHQPLPRCDSPGKLVY